MPEGPEVRKEAQQLSRVILNTTLSEIAVVSGRYLKNPLFGPSIWGSRVLDVRNHGKLLIIALEDDNGDPLYIHSTLGMTGWWSTSNSKYERLKLRGSATISFHDPRNFGTLKVVTEDEHRKKIRSLGPDFSRISQENIDTIRAEVISRIERFGTKQTIGQALLDQRIFCGIGNYLRADALYLAGINPHLNAKSLDSERLDTLIMNCGIVSMAAYQNSSPLVGVRGPYHHVAYHRSRSINGNPIISEQVDGRAIWWCPAEQT